MTNLSSLTAVFKKILQKWAFLEVVDAAHATLDTGASVWHYGDSEQFSKLWSEVDVARGTVIVLWDFTPYAVSMSPVDVAEHLTPLHWAACAAALSRFALDIWVVDLTPSASGRNPCIGEYLRFKEAQFPWLHLVTPLEMMGQTTDAARRFDDLCSGNCKEGDALTTLEVRNLDSGAVVPQSEHRRQSADVLLDRVKSIMFADSNSEGRHALSNVLGPILLGVEQAIQDRGHIKGLKWLLLAMRAVRITQEPRREPLPSLRSLEFKSILFDDMAQNGWEDWLKTQICEAAGRRLDLKAETAPEHLLAEVERLMSIHEDGEQPLVRDEGRIVFLDLRLFHQDSAREEDFYSRLETKWLAWQKQMGRKFTRTWQRRWPGHRGSSKSQSLKRLLPAMCLAQLDPLLPIVIFSSASDRQIVQRLSVYGNISTVFSKPVLFGAGSENPQAASTKLRDALEWAAGLLRLRSRCRALRGLLHEPEGTPTRIPLAKGERLHVELFLDESGDSKVIDQVGGIFAIHVAPDALSHANSFDDALIDAGLRYFRDTFRLWAGEQRILAKKTDHGVVQFANALQKESSGHYFGLLRLKIPSGNISNDSGLSDDVNYWRLIRHMIELFEVYVLPEITLACELHPDHLSFAIYAGTRAKPSANKGNQDYKHGFFRPGGRKTQTFSPHDLFWIRTAIAEDHPRTDRRQVWDCKRAVAVSLPYSIPGPGATPSDPTMVTVNDSVFEFKAAPEPSLLKKIQGYGVDCDFTGLRYDYRALHYVADQVLRHWDEYQKNGALRLNAPAQFFGSMDAALEEAMEAGRHLAGGDIGQAIADFGDVGGADQGRRLIGRAIARAMEGQLTEDQILRAQRLMLITWGSKPVKSEPR